MNNLEIALKNQEKINSLINRPGMQAAIKISEQIANIYTPETYKAIENMSLVLKELGKTIEGLNIDTYYITSNLARSMKPLQEELSIISSYYKNNLNFDFSELQKQINAINQSLVSNSNIWNDISLNLTYLEEMRKSYKSNNFQVNKNGSFTVDDNEYSPIELANEIVCELNELDKNNKINKETIRKIRAKITTLVFILNLIIFIIPKLPDGIENAYKFYNEFYMTITGKNIKCYVIVDKAKIYKSNNAKSNVLEILVYDTELEILDDVSRWYKVQFVNEDGKNIIGWVAKRNVEK